MTRERQIEDWLRGGGQVVTASERAARAIASEYNQSRRAEGETAWLAPAVADWSGFVRREWERLSACDERVAMNREQELALWQEIVAASAEGSRLDKGSLRRMADKASEAHGLLCAYAPDLLKEHRRSSWFQDQGAFSGWLGEFERACGEMRMVSLQRLAVELLSLLRRENAQRGPLLLAGFDRMASLQMDLLAAWGEWSVAAVGEPAENKCFYEAADEIAELEACARWCALRLASNPDAQLLVVTQDASARRGEIERAFLSAVGERFEFSLGVPLRQIPVIRAAHLSLRWLDGEIDEHELDWLLGSGRGVTSEAETLALTGFLREIRRRRRERPRWSLTEFMKEQSRAALPAGWTARMSAARERLGACQRRLMTASAWAEVIPEVLATAGWPGGKPLTSVEFQATKRLQHAFDVCASLGFDGRRMEWSEFLHTLGSVLSETLFAPQSEGAPVQIVGPMESAGLSADAIWFLGVSQQAWPPMGRLHPLIPIEEQRQYRMPHATAQQDGDLARTATERLVRSTPEIRFSYAGQMGGVEQKPARLAIKTAGVPQSVPDELCDEKTAATKTKNFEDSSRICFIRTSVAGGSALVSAQSQCPFKAFASARLGADGWQRAEAGLTAMQRGTLLHEVLHAVWAAGSMRTHAELRTKQNLEEFVGGHVRDVLATKMPAGVRERMPAGYLALEQQRLTRLVTEWLEYERTRVEFEVEDTEVNRTVRIKGLELKLRLDRMDKLNDGKILVIDYKSGQVDLKDWQPRASDLQLPLYASFALKDGEELGGLAFAQVRPGAQEFTGSLYMPKETLFAELQGSKSLAKQKLTEGKLKIWKEEIEGLVAAFLDGHAEVDPIDSKTTCKFCDLKPLCRIAESAEDEEEPEETGEESYE